MELVAGQPCTEYCDERQLVVADRVKLLDFGIAKLLADDPADLGLTSAGRRVLTLSYSSPEQIRGEPVTTASDVYSLGVLLYELLAGRSPYGTAGGSRATLERAVLEVEPSPPSAGRELSRDLDAIVLKALRKEPSERYPSVEAFAQDVRSYLEGRPVTARRGTLRYRTARFVRRHAVSLAAAGIVVGLFALAGVLHARRLARERSVAQREAEKAFLLTDFAFSMVEGASGGLEGRVPAWLPTAERQARAYLRVDLEWAEAARLMGEALPNVERSLDGTDPELGGLAFYERTLPPGDARIIEGRELARTAGP